MNPTEEILQECYIRAMRAMVDIWGSNEHAGYGIHRTILHNGDIVGLVHLRTLNGKNSPEGVLEFLMMPKYCGMGIATNAVSLMVNEAFNLHSFNHIIAKVFATNNAAIRVLQKNGFHHESTSNAVSCNGKPNDQLVFSISRGKPLNQNGE